MFPPGPWQYVLVPQVQLRKPYLSAVDVTWPPTDEYRR